MTLKVMLLLAALQAAAFGESKVMTWEIDGVKREAIVYLPAKKAAANPLSPAPVNTSSRKVTPAPRSLVPKAFPSPT